MNIISLIDPESSPIPIKVDHYPDGQHGLTILAAPNRTLGRVTIETNARNFAELELVVLAKKALENMSFGHGVVLKMPYVPGARSDRKFADGGVRYLSQVVAPLINSLRFAEVIVYDPHSYVVENCVERCRIVSHAKIFSDTLTALKEELLAAGKFSSIEMVAPDAGATKRAQETADAVGASYLACSKERTGGRDGKVSVKLPAGVPQSGVHYVVCDDICDGGKTFLDVGRQFEPKTISLCVTHGLFSNRERFSEMCDMFHSIVTTDSCGKIPDLMLVDAANRGCSIVQITA